MEFTVGFVDARGSFCEVVIGVGGGEKTRGCGEGVSLVGEEMDRGGYDGCDCAFLFAYNGCSKEKSKKPHI